MSDAVVVTFQGFAEGSDVLASTQADFLVDLPERNGREVSVLVNDPTASHVAEALGLDDSAETRTAITRQLGQVWLERKAASGEHFAPIVFITRRVLEDDPSLVDALRTLPGRMAPQK